MKKILLFITLITIHEAQARPISNVALFRRCYSLITQNFPGLNHPVLANVRAGRANPIDACLQILDKAQITSSGTVANTADTEARQILNNFQSLHYSWMDSRNFDSSQPKLLNDATKDLYDIATPAYYYTRAMFKSDMKFSEIFTTSAIYGPVRTNMNLTNGAFTNRPLSDWHLKIKEFVPTGDLIGVRSIAPYSVSLTLPTATDRNKAAFGETATLYKNYGGGVIGATPYINISIRNGSLIRSNAGPDMPRKWSKAVLNDFMCRELPVLRTADITKYVAASSNITFRKSESCVRCHATMDQMGATIRHVALTNYESPYTQPFPIMILNYTTRLPAEASWPIIQDSSYYLRPTTGRFVFRTYEGTAIDMPVASTQALGEQISQLKDPYVCAAKRYYQYFMGVDVPMKDFSDPDPSSGYKLSATEQKHWRQIVKLGLELKSHQSVRKLIEAILRQASFRESDFDNNGDLL